MVEQIDEMAIEAEAARLADLTRMKFILALENGGSGKRPDLGSKLRSELIQVHRERGFKVEVLDV